MGDDVMRDINTTFDCFDDLICSEEEDEDDDGGGCGDIKIEFIPPVSEWGDDVGWMRRRKMKMKVFGAMIIVI